jgi:2-oxoglutarate dehydrogenase complex dehydrogenase (E1) component-like enzyme
MQEEHMNEGAFQWAKLHVDRILKKHQIGTLGYVGRLSQHSFATGASVNHKYETEKLWKDFEAAVYK